MRSFKVPSFTIYRVGYSSSTWNLPDWQRAEKGTFDGRLDDPRGTFRIRYAAFDPACALVEALQRYRPDMRAIAEMREIVGGGAPVVPALPLQWFEEYELGRAELVLHESDLLDLTTGEGISAAASAINAAQREVGKSYDIDAATLMSNDRSFTQALSRYIYDFTDFAGIVYRSKFAPEMLCIALYEQRHGLKNPTTRKIRPTDPDFKKARRTHRLILLVPA